MRLVLLRLSWRPQKEVLLDLVVLLHAFCELLVLLDRCGAHASAFDRVKSL